MRLSSLALALSLSSPALLFAQPIPLRAAVLPHIDPVPGVPGGVFSSGSPPTQIDSQGHVSFRAGFTSPLGTGLWSEGSGTLSLIAIEGGPVPGVPGAVFTTFNGVNILMSDNNRVAFRSSINPGSLTGVWSQEGAALALAALHSQPSPGSPPGTWELNSNLPTVTLSTAGKLSFKGGVTTPQPANSYIATFTGFPSAMGMCSRTAAAPDSGFTSFGEVQIDDTGRTGFATGFRLPGGSGSSGIFEGTCGSPNTLVANADIVPAAAGLPSGTTYVQPREPSFGQAGHCTFLTGFGGPNVNSNNDSAIMLLNPSGQTVVAREGTQVPGLPAGIVFADFTSGTLRGPLMSLSGHVAFLCTVTGGGSDLTNNRVLVIRRPDGVVRVLARLGDTPATYPPTTTITSFGSDLFALNASGQAVVELDLLSAPANRGNALFLTSDSSGNTSILFESSTTHTVRQGPNLDIRVLNPTTGPQLSNAHDGRGHSWNDAGQLAFRANYANPANPNISLGIGVFVVGGPRPCPADFDGDGTVDFFDYDAFVTCFEGGACPPGKTADFDGDGSSDFFDYDAFVVAFESPC